MTYDSLIKEFMEKFPELREEADKELHESWHTDERLVHVFFGNVVNPFLVRELVMTENPIVLDRIFEFLESMANSDDKLAREVLTDTILEWLGDDRQRLEKARSLMASNTLKASHKIEKQWGRE